MLFAAIFLIFPTAGHIFLLHRMACMLPCLGYCAQEWLAGSVIVAIHNLSTIDMLLAYYGFLTACIDCTRNTGYCVQAWFAGSVIVAIHNLCTIHMLLAYYSNCLLTARIDCTHITALLLQALRFLLFKASPSLSTPFACLA